MLNPFNIAQGVGPLDPMALMKMGEASSFAQLALRSPELTAGMLAAQGVPPPPPAPPKVGALVAGPKPGEKPNDPIANFTKALSNLEPEPPQAPMAAPGVIAPNAGKGQIDTANIMRMMQLMAPAAVGRTPSLGALIGGR
jgi:hypothetical protein